MKKSVFLLALCAAAFGFTGCSNDNDGADEVNVLATPMLTQPSVTHNTATVTWKAVDNAEAYIYTVNGGSELTCTDPTVTVTGLNPATNYTFSVKATKPGSSLFKDSEWATVTFTTADEPVASAGLAYVKTYGDKWDTWFYTYNADWTPKRIYRTTDGTENGPLDREWNFAYDGNKIIVSGKNNYSMTRNDKGYVTELVDGSTTYGYAYDDEGHMIQVTKNGDVVCNITIENGDIAKWSRFKDGAEQWKLHTYLPIENVGGCHAVTAESIGASRWLIETHLFGVASKHLHATNAWEGAEKSSTFTFDTDDKGRVTVEHKLYGESLEEYFYTYMD